MAAGGAQVILKGFVWPVDLTHPAAHTQQCTHHPISERLHTWHWHPCSQHWEHHHNHCGIRGKDPSFTSTRVRSTGSTTTTPTMPHAHRLCYGFTLPVEHSVMAPFCRLLQHWEHHNHCGIRGQDPDFHHGNPHWLPWFIRCVTVYLCGSSA